MKAAALRAMIETAKAKHGGAPQGALLVLDVEHSEALITLLEVCEVRSLLSCEERCSPNGWFHAAACEARLSAADRAIDEATTAVHAIGLDRVEHVGCVYPAGQKCRGADRCQFLGRCVR